FAAALVWAGKSRSEDRRWDTGGDERHYPAERRLATSRASSGTDTNSARPAAGASLRVLPFAAPVASGGKYLRAAWRDLIGDCLAVLASGRLRGGTGARIPLE